MNKSCLQDAKNFGMWVDDAQTKIIVTDNYMSSWSRKQNWKSLKQTFLILNGPYHILYLSSPASLIYLTFLPEACAYLIIKLLTIIIVQQMIKREVNFSSPLLLHSSLW